MPTSHATPAPIAMPLPAVVRRAVRCGLPIALLSAAALSFQGLYLLARAVGWAPSVAWLLPVSIDVAAAIATAVWLGTPAAYGAARGHAARTALVAITLSVLGNAAAHLIEGHILAVTPAVIVTVTSVPPIVVALLVHLGMSLPATTANPEPAGIDPQPENPTGHERPGDERQGEAIPGPRRTVAEAVATATALLDAERRAGRDPAKLTSTPVARRLGCTPSYARRILRKARAEHGTVKVAGEDSNTYSGRAQGEVCPEPAASLGTL